jgi:type IV pilus assembly protein PilC
MQFNYTARTQDGKQSSGTVSASSVDAVVASLQRRNLIITSVKPISEGPRSILRSDISEWLGRFGVLQRVKTQDVVVLSRQLATLFESKIPIVSALQVLISETENKTLKHYLSDILDDIRGGVSFSQALSKHPRAFSRFYIAMVQSGEEAGKLEEVFQFLADYLERSFELQRRARNALIYPAFILSAFVAVMVLMLIFVIPKLSTILVETGQDIPLYTKFVIGISNLLLNFGLILLLFIVGLGVFVVRYARSANGKIYFARLTLSLPILGALYKKIYLSRIADNLSTLLSGGITAMRALEVTSEVVGNVIYQKILLDAVRAVRGGAMISDSLGKFNDIPSLFSQMIRIGEETGQLDSILKNLAGFYRRDVNNLVDNLVSLIEPILILALGLGVGLLVASVLVPIYNISATF